LSVSAPGRVCLFGEHQDYLGLPVIPCAVNLRMVITGCTRDDGVFRARDTVHGVSARFDLDDLGYISDDFDYLRAVARVMIDEGRDISGADVDLRSEVPISSGLSSSAAMLVAFAKFLDEAFSLGHDPASLAMVCYRAEHDELGVPCGVMDQLSSSIGGIIRIDCGYPPVVGELAADIGEMVIGDTGIRKSTMDVHSSRTVEIEEAIGELSRLAGKPVQLREICWEDLEELLPGLGEVPVMRLRATIKNRDITLRAAEILGKARPDLEALGSLMLQHHAHLRDDYQVSHPALDRLIRAGMSAGALGGKLTGAGLGGCVVMMAPGRGEEVARAIRSAGGTPHIVRVDGGARREL